VGGFRQSRTNPMGPRGVLVESPGRTQVDQISPEGPFGLRVSVRPSGGRDLRDARTGAIRLCPNYARAEGNRNKRDQIGTILVC
jgi:hypothetical protein